MTLKNTFIYLFFLHIRKILDKRAGLETIGLRFYSIPGKFWVDSVYHGSRALKWYPSVFFHGETHYLYFSITWFMMNRIKTNINYKKKKNPWPRILFHLLFIVNARKYQTINGTFSFSHLFQSNLIRNLCLTLN